MRWASKGSMREMSPDRASPRVSSGRRGDLMTPGLSVLACTCCPARNRPFTPWARRVPAAHALADTQLSLELLTDRRISFCNRRRCSLLGPPTQG